MAGRRFGALVVVEEAGSIDGRAAWHCRCDCGRECIVQGKLLRNGMRTSCGCRAGAAAKRIGREMPELQKDYTGKTFGELTAIRRVGPDRWLWRCACGAEKEIRASDVERGNVTSCGHILKAKATEKYFEKNVFEFSGGTELSLLRGIVNGKVRSNNTSGVTGVNAVRRAGGRTAYKARITFRGKEYNLGVFDTLEEAKEARKRAEETYFRSALNES